MVAEGTESATGNALLDVVGQMFSCEPDRIIPASGPAADAPAKTKAVKPGSKTPRSDKSGDEKPKRGLTPGFCLHCGKTMDTEWRFERTRCNACGLYKMRHGGMDKPPHLMSSPMSAATKLNSRLAALSAMAKGPISAERSVITTLKGTSHQLSNAAATRPHGTSAAITALSPSHPMVGLNGSQQPPHVGGQRQITTQPVGLSVAAVVRAATTSTSQGAPLGKNNNNNGGNNNSNKAQQLLGNKATMPANPTLSGKTRKLSELATENNGTMYAGRGQGDSSSSGVSTQVPTASTMAAVGGPGAGSMMKTMMTMPAGSQPASAEQQLLPPSKRARSGAGNGTQAAANSGGGVTTSVPLHLVNCCNAAQPADTPAPVGSAGHVQAMMPATADAVNAGSSRVVHVVQQQQQQQPMMVAAHSGAVHPAAPVQYMMVGGGMQPVHMMQGQAVHAVQQQGVVLQQQQQQQPVMVQQHMVVQQAPVHGAAAASGGGIVQGPGGMVYRMLGPAGGGGHHYVQQPQQQQQQQQYMMVLGPPQNSGNMLHQQGTMIVHHHPQQQGVAMGHQLQLQQQQQYGAPHGVMMMGPAVTMAAPQQEFMMVQQPMVQHQFVQQQQQQPVYVMQGMLC